MGVRFAEAAGAFATGIGQSTANGIDTTAFYNYGFIHGSLLLDRRRAMLARRGDNELVPVLAHVTLPWIWIEAASMLKAGLRMEAFFVPCPVLANMWRWGLHQLGAEEAAIVDLRRCAVNLPTAERSQWTDSKMETGSPSPAHLH